MENFCTRSGSGGGEKGERNTQFKRVTFRHRTVLAPKRLSPCQRSQPRWTKKDNTHCIANAFNRSIVFCRLLRYQVGVAPHSPLTLQSREITGPLFCRWRFALLVCFLRHLQFCSETHRTRKKSATTAKSGKGGAQTRHTAGYEKKWRG